MITAATVAVASGGSVELALLGLGGLVAVIVAGSVLAALGARRAPDDLSEEEEVRR
jgi:hypothetical protein